MTVGIQRIGAYVPRLRLLRAEIVRATAWFNQATAASARGERSVANWDEDVLTMAVEASRDCLHERSREDIARVVLASTSLPFADRLNAGIVKEALGLPDEIGAFDVTGSQRGGASALLSALESCASAGPVLCVASEQRTACAASPAELANGDAAVALLVAAGAGIAEFVGGHSTTVDFVDRFRATDRAYDYEWESRWIRDEGYLQLIPQAIEAALRKCGVEATQVDHLALGLPIAGTERVIAAAAGVAVDCLVPSLHESLGYAGAAQPLLLLARALERAVPGQVVVVAAFGQGVDVLVFRTTEALAVPTPALGLKAWLARRKTESNYVKYLYFTRQLKLDEGMRAELDLKTPASMLYRDRRTVLALVGGKCSETGAVQYPKSAISVDPEARTVGTQSDYPLADLRARLVSFTADWLAYTPDPPSCYGIVDFDGGGRMLADIVDIDEEGLPVGAALRMMFRLKRRDARGFRHYFWKAVPDYRRAPDDGVSNG